MWKIATTMWITLFWIIKIFSFEFVSWTMDNEKKVLKSFVQFFGIIVNVNIQLIWKDWSFI
jgi:hypothetical protein